MARWTDPTYSLTLDSRGVRFYGSEIAEINASSFLTIQSEAQATITATYNKQSSIEIESNVVAISLKETTASSALDSTLTTVTVAVEILKAIAIPSASVSVNVVSKKIAISESEISINSDVQSSGTGIFFASSEINIESNVATSSIEILSALSQVDIESNCSVSSIKIAKSSAILSGELSANTVSTKIRFGSSQIAIESNFVSSAYEILLLQSLINVESNTSVSALEILFASSNINPELTSTATGIRFQLAEIDISAFSVTAVVGQHIYNIRPNPTGLAILLKVSAIKFSNSIIEDTDDIRPLFIIDNKPITEHNRGTTVSVVQSFIENTNWKASRSRYYKTGSPRKTFSINWSNLPSSRSQTVDIKFGRDAIREIASDPDIHILKFLDIDSDGTTPYTETEYNVVVKNYSENLIRRDVGDDLYLWDCSLELEEV